MMFLRDGCSHQFRELVRYIPYTAASTNAEPPPDAPVCINEQCTICWGYRTRYEAQPQAKPSPPT